MYLIIQNVTSLFNQNLVLIILIIILISIWFLAQESKHKKRNFHFDAEAMEVAKASAELKRKYNYKELMPEHFLWALFESPGKKLEFFLSHNGLDPSKGKKLLEDLFVQKSIKNEEVMPSQPYLGEHVKQVIDKAKINIGKRKAIKISPIDLFESLLEEAVFSNENVYNELKKVIKSMDVSLEETHQHLKKFLKTNESTKSPRES